MEAPITNETVQNLFNELGLSVSHLGKRLEKLIHVDSRYIKDLKINVSNVLSSKNLNKKEAFLLALSVAVNEKHHPLQESLERMALNEGATDAEIAEVISATSLMNVNNVFYRFRHFVDNEFYDQAPAGIKMSIMMNPVVGKEFFELLSLMVSALNGCEMCVRSHEESVKSHGGSRERIFDAVRLGAVFKGLMAIV